MPKASASKYQRGSLKAKVSISSETELTKVLNKFNKNDLISNFIEKEQIREQIKVTKKNAIKLAINILTEKFTNLEELILFLHLNYIQIQNRKRIWTAYEMKEAKRLSKRNVTADVISQSLLRYFKDKYDVPCNVYTEKKRSCFWIALFLGNAEPQRPIFIIVHTILAAVFCSKNVKSQYSLLVEKVIRKTFRGCDIEKLSEINADSKYFLNVSHKSFASLKKKAVSKTRPAAKKSRLENASENDSADDFEDIQKRKKPQQKNPEDHGLPEIKKLKYFVRSSKFAEQEINDEKLYSVCGVEFKGTNILKGLERLVESGIADKNLPDYLSKEPRSGKTEFEVTIS